MYRTPDEAKAATQFLRFLLRSKKTGAVIGNRRENKAQDLLIRSELQRALDEQGRRLDPPRALRVDNGYWIVYRSRQGGPVLTVGTVLDETIVRAVINHIEAEGGPIITGKSCALCDIWMVPGEGIPWSKAFDKDARDATVKLLHIGADLPYERTVGCCANCQSAAYERIEEDLLARHDAWQKDQKARWQKSRWYRTGRKLRELLSPGG